MIAYKYVTKHGHPNAQASGKIFEHVFIMSEMLGRPLAALEVVHHVDEDKRNNSPKNLQLFATDIEHQMHHRHLRAMQECGNPDYRKCSHCKIYDDPTNMALYQNGSNSVRAVHASCASIDATKRVVKSRATPEGRAKANAWATKSYAKKKLLKSQQGL